MTTAENTSDSRLWDSSILSNKSWVELVEEEERELENAKNIVGSHREDYLHDDSSSTIPFSGVNNIKTEVKIEPEDDDAAVDVDVPTLPSKIPVVDDLPTFGKVGSSSSLHKTPVKKEPGEVFQEDISLTGHLDGFKLVSPCKVDGASTAGNSQTNNTFKTPEKCLPIRQYESTDKSRDKQTGSSCKRKLTGVKADDSTLMPSPSKMCRVTAESTPPPSAGTRKRLRDNLTPTPKRSPTKKKREPETDPEIIARRQKQIDYGKNTIGYERYRQLVPKESRKKMHPRTPPLQLKFSRRAWDGLVKVWRQRLHFWDPPSEGGGNPECLEVHSEISDCSSTDGSLPSTPVQEWKRQKSSLPGWSPCASPLERSLRSEESKSLRTHHSIRKLTSIPKSTEKIGCGEKLNGSTEMAETSEQFLSQGCTPLPD